MIIPCDKLMKFMEESDIHAVFIGTLDAGEVVFVSTIEMDKDKIEERTTAESGLPSKVLATSPMRVIIRHFVDYLIAENVIEGIDLEDKSD